MLLLLQMIRACCLRSLLWRPSQLLVFPRGTVAHLCMSMLYITIVTTC